MNEGITDRIGKAITAWREQGGRAAPTLLYLGSRSVKDLGDYIREVIEGDWVELHGRYYWDGMRVVNVLGDVDHCSVGATGEPEERGHHFNTEGTEVRIYHGRWELPLPSDDQARKRRPIATGVLDYFPDAIAAVAEVSLVGNEQHQPGEPMRWDRSKSTDEANSLIRHFMERGLRDKDGLRHSAKTAWRALALLQREIEKERGG